MEIGITPRAGKADTGERIAGARLPDILWVVTTQWRAQALGYTGDPNARTPYLDALAAESVNFRQAVTPHPFGPFARAALLTGVPSPENGVREYFDPLPTSARTIAHELGERGYATAFFGKWHLWRRDPAAALVGDAHAKMIVPVEARGGFEFWEGFESGFLLNNPWLHGTHLTKPAQFHGYQSDVLCERAEHWLREQIANAELQTPKGTAEARPWFCVVSLEAPHPPYDAPAASVAATRPETVVLGDNVPRGGEAEATARRELAGYYAHIEATDRAIGRLIDGLKVRGAEAWKNTLVVFTSVHGDMHGAHGLFRKGWPYEESVRVPLLVKLPGDGTGRAKGEIRDDCVSLLDLPAFVKRYVKTGESSWVKNGGAKISMPSVVALPHQADRVWRGVRTARRKVVLNADGTPWLFFDLERDPSEMNNLAHVPVYAAEMAELSRLV